MGTFIVTGGSRGLGKEVARAALSRGFDVALIARNLDDLEAAKSQLGNEFASRHVSIHRADLSDENECRLAFDEIFAQHPKIRCLVNNAATWTGGKSCNKLSAIEVRQSFELNFMSAFFATMCVVHKHNGTDELSIINVGATASLRGSANNAAFCVAKSALRTFSQSLAKEVGLSGIHVAHLVIDGLIANERTIKLNPGRPSDRYVFEESIAKEVLHVSLQSRDCWTFEWDIRTNNAD